YNEEPPSSISTARSLIAWISSQLPSAMVAATSCTAVSSSCKQTSTARSIFVNPPSSSISSLPTSLQNSPMLQPFPPETSSRKPFGSKPYKNSRPRSLPNVTKKPPLSNNT